MANFETQQLDNIIASRRAMLLGGGAALAAFALPKAASAAATVTTFTDADILNFALNLEYLEANFYYLAAFGTTIDKPNTLYPAGAMVQGIDGVGTPGTVSAPAVTKVPFASTAIAGYAVETAIEEGKHVAFLRNALGAAKVAQPALNLGTSFDMLAAAAGIGPAFNPYASDANFLIGAYVFEDVGVSAYSGAAPLISTTPAGKGILTAAAGILAVEAYHAGLIRTTLNGLDAQSGYTLGYAALTAKISALRAALSKAVSTLPGTPPYPSAATNPFGDDVPVTPGTVTVSLAGAAPVTATTIVDADQVTVIAFPRSTTEVLNIVTGGGAATAGTKATGVFFPNGLNGTFA